MAVRKLLFQIHMWIGLVLGLLLMLLGLSGSSIVYDDAIARFLSPPPAAHAVGAPLSLDAIAQAARASQNLKRGAVTITPATTPGEAAMVRIGNLSRMGSMPGMARNRGIQVYIDPVSGAVLGTTTQVLPPVLVFAHQLHGNFLMGRDGRSFVGWLGVAMVILGLSGLVLWWPKAGQWKYAFIVRRKAKGLRFHRELHAMLGIWAFIVFIIVSFSGVELAWPRMMGAPQQSRDAVTFEPLEGAPRIGADRAAAIAKAAAPGMMLRSITLPGRRDEAIAVNYLSNGAIAATLYIDPTRASVIAVRDPSQNFMAWQRPVHTGNLGAVWKFLVFLIGLLPTVFLVTGVAMWMKKRKNHIAMNAPLADERPA